MFVHAPIEMLPDVPTIEKHGKRFYVVGDKQYPSITTILSDGDKPWVADWRNSLGHQKADKETKRAADRGTAVHSMIEKMLNNEESPSQGFNVSDVAEFNSLRVFLRKINNIITQETALWSDTLQIAGRVDCIGEYKGKLCVIDFKTSSNVKTAEIIKDYFMQVTAYSLMFQELYDIQIDDFVILMSVERGMVPMIFTGKVEDHIPDLLKKINTFHKKHGSKK